MHSHADPGWWGALCERLRREPLHEVCAALGVGVDEAERALAAREQPECVTRAAWWPEVLRRLAVGGSIRDTARRFGATPRRLRRALARGGWRVRGRDLHGEGVPELTALVDRIGKMPDMVIARLAGIGVEAVIGERRRLRRRPFRLRRQRTVARMRAQQRKAAAPPPPRPRARPAPAVEVPTVVRRPMRAAPPVVLGVRAADDRGGAGADRPPLRSAASPHGLPIAGGPALVPAPGASAGPPAAAPVLVGGEVQRRRIVRPPSPGEPGAKARS
jgi:hypothetical protein